MAFAANRKTFFLQNRAWRAESKAKETQLVMQHVPRTPVVDLNKILLDTKHSVFAQQHIEKRDKTKLDFLRCQNTDALTIFLTHEQ